MELLEKIIFLVVAIVCVIVLITMAWNFFKNQPQDGSMTVSGDKKTVVNAITEEIYKCFEKNRDSRLSVVCIKGEFNSTKEINSTDILDKLDASRIDKNNVKADNLGVSGKIIIRYENQFIYVKRVENEGTSL